MDEEEVQRRLRQILTKGIERAAAEEGMSVEDYQKMMEPYCKKAEDILQSLLSGFPDGGRNEAIEDADGFLQNCMKNAPKPGM